MTAGLLRVRALGRIKKSTGCIGSSEAQGSREKGHPPSSPKDERQDKSQGYIEEGEDLKLGSEYEDLVSKYLSHQGL